MTLFSHSDTIRELTNVFLDKNPNHLLLCEGIDDGFYSTINGLPSLYPSQCYELPCSENSMVGMALSASNYEVTTLVCLQRVEFALLAIEQLANNAAKNHYLTDGNRKNPCLFRFVVGRGWGQGPSHSQSFETMFSQIPDINVFMPVFPNDSKIIFKDFKNQSSPTISLEHRWTHYAFDTEGSLKNNKTSSYCLRNGTDITIICYSYNVLLVNAISSIFSGHHISLEIINLFCLTAIDYELISNSVKKTRHLLLLDLDDRKFSVSSDILGNLLFNGSLAGLNKNPIRLANHQTYSPSSPYLSNEYYLTGYDIAEAIINMLDVAPEQAKSILKGVSEIESEVPCDVPNKGFSGPF